MFWPTPSSASVLQYSTCQHGVLKTSETWQHQTVAAHQKTLKTSRETILCVALYVFILEVKVFLEGYEMHSMWIVKLNLHNVG